MSLHYTRPRKLDSYELSKIEEKIGHVKTEPGEDLRLAQRLLEHIAYMETHYAEKTKS